MIMVKKAHIVLVFCFLYGCVEPFEAETVQGRKELFNTKLFVPFFLQNLTDFFFGSKQLGSISRLFSEMTKETKDNLKRLVN